MRERPVEAISSICLRATTSTAPSAAFQGHGPGGLLGDQAGEDAPVHRHNDVVEIVRRDLAVGVEDVDEQVFRRTPRHGGQVGTDLSPGPFGPVAGGADLGEDRLPLGRLAGEFQAPCGTGR